MCKRCCYLNIRNEAWVIKIHHIVLGFRPMNVTLSNFSGQNKKKVRSKTVDSHYTINYRTVCQICYVSFTNIWKDHPKWTPYSCSWFEPNLNRTFVEISREIWKITVFNRNIVISRQIYKSIIKKKIITWLPYFRIMCF